jgi:hypothetical protein
MLRCGLPPARLGKRQSPRLAHDLPVLIGTPSFRQAAFSPISKASILNASLFTAVGFVFFFIVVTPLLCIAFCFG